MQFDLTALTQKCLRHTDLCKHGTCACKCPISELNRHGCSNAVGMRYFSTSGQFVFFKEVSYFSSCCFVLLLCVKESLNGEKMPQKVPKLHVLQLWHGSRRYLAVESETKR